ncbi:MAG: Uncharacterized protein G01um10147_96 [Microgenomates group bacterium Gr01-1014_7]|nr:MAG: Uncharacterized protein G01um10147_96 [Microgenomates group bacterium Gr01-1014_7]
MLKIILPLIILAFILRILFISQGAVSFHYDMARDAFIALQIWNGDLKILGPPTSTPGLFHGALYYYLLAPFYGLGKGDPRVVAFFLAFLNSLAVFPIMFLAKDLFKNIKWAILAGLLFAVSFEANQYGPWLSNPSPSILTVILFFYFLRIWQKGENKALYLAFLSAVISSQFQFFLIYLLLLIPIFGYLFKIKVTLNQIRISSILAILGLSPFIIAAIKFQTLQTFLGGFLNIATATQVDFRPPFSQALLNYVDRFSEIFIYNFFPTNVFLGGLLALVVLPFLRKEKLILFYLFSNFPIFIFGGHSNTYANVGLVVGAILAVINMIKILTKWSKVLAVLLVLLIIVSNLYSHFKNSPLGQIILVIPNDMVLKNQIDLIDQTYKKAEGQPFSINTLTLPLWTNTTWAYLYSWYGKQKYGYVPEFTGHDQVGLLGVNDLKKIDKPLDKSFFIIEPHVGIPDTEFNLEIGSENSKTDLISEIKYEGLILQFRKPKSDAKQ